MRRPLRTALAATALVALAGTELQLAPAAGATGPVDMVVTQWDCDSGSVTPLWSGTGITTRPTIVSASIDGETIDPADLETPQTGEIGAAICAQDPDFAKNSGLTFYKKTSGGAQSNLTGAVTPLGHTITASSQITVTVDMGDLSAYFSFATVFGQVNSWTTTGLKTGSATVTMNVTPADGVMVDGMDEFGHPSAAEQGCTQQPPNCDPPKADLDTFGVYMQFKAERGPQTAFDTFAGGYFALRSAVGGFVAPRDGGLEVSIAGPHFKADGTTLNVGSMSAFLPETFLTNSFGITSAQVTDTTFAITRTEDGSSSAAPWTYRVVPGGIAVDVANITFSTPVYRIAKGTPAPTVAPTPAAAPKWPAPLFFNAVRKGRSVHAGFATSPRAQYVVTYTNLFRTYHVNVTSTSDKWKTRWVSKRLTRGTWLVIGRQRIGSDFSNPALRVVTVR